MNKLRIREAGALPQDDAYIVEVFDSTLPYLEAMGSHGMWGSRPFSEKEGFREQTARDVRASERYRARGEGEALRIFIADAEVQPSSAAPLLIPSGGDDEPRRHAGLRYWTGDDGALLLSVGAVFVRDNWLPGHVKSQFHVDAIRAELEGKEGFVYLDVLVTDFRTGHERQGAGEALVKQARDYGLERGAKTLYLDAWAGNGRKLVEFYRKLGFSIVADFEMKRANGTIWPGTLMRVGLEGSERNEGQ
ncbi:acetyltransferase [Colletotrichum graminicola]|uniref:Acetyltransferase n=1 Tax=Colletotrichum graminicola (strain M1.001 / M2 / FGSC 10212) TaxID=645133 RepID=E3Q3L9_COLGM|nr:acetyltransferase [Colletotrichum graminicola M1.001]EFQ25621.1 acetyltransferase [Colletotrichum graminicola M1.001]WDK11045.1 acetyltransferase [Colletotrichum graminicola]